MIDKIYKIYLIKSIDNEMQYYGYTTSNLNFILNNNYYYYKQYKENNKNKHITLFNIFDKYSFDDIEIILMQECKKEELKEQKNLYIHNNKNCVNKRGSSNINNIKEIYKITKKKYRDNNEDRIIDYNKNYYKLNIEKFKKFYDEKKDFIYQKILCECGKYVMKNKKSCLLIHNQSNYHLKHINKTN